MKNNSDVVNSSQVSREGLLELLNTYREATDELLICSITDTNGVITYANQNFRECSQYSECELIGHSHEMVESGYHPKMFFQKMWETVGKGNIWHREVKNMAKDGSSYWMDTVMLPLKDKNGNPLQYLTLQFLITEAKEAEEKRIKYLECMENILFMVSHKIRRPIATFLGLMQLIDQDKLLTDKDQKKILEYTKSSVQELDTFTKEMTTFIVKIKEMYEKQGDQGKED